MDVDDLWESSWFKPALALGISGLIIFYLFSGGLLGLSITQGFEGEQNGLYGYQVSGFGTVSLGNKLSAPNGACSYSYSGSATISAFAVKATTPGVFGYGCGIYENSDTLQVDTQTNLQSYSEPYSSPITVNYYIQVPGSSNQYQHVTGEVKEYLFTTDISIASGSSGRWTFSGDTIWFNLASTVWNQASTDPTNSSAQGNVFESPLYAVVTNVQWQDQGTSQLDASVVGHAITFYTSPSTTGQTLATLTQNQPPSESLNSSLSSQYSPDSRMQRLVYYPVSIVGMVPSCPVITGQCTYPSVRLTMKVYTLQLGEYILTNPDRTVLSNRTQGCTGTGCLGDIWSGLIGFLSNPLGQLELGVYLIVFFAVMVAVAVFVLTRKTPV